MFQHLSAIATWLDASSISGRPTDAAQTEIRSRLQQANVVRCALLRFVIPMFFVCLFCFVLCVFGHDGPSCSRICVCPDVVVSSLIPKARLYKTRLVLC